MNVDILMGSKMIKMVFTIIFQETQPSPFSVRCYLLDNITKLDQRTVFRTSGIQNLKQIDFLKNISKTLKRLKMKVNIIFFFHVYDARFGIKSHFISLSISRGFKIRITPSMTI